MQYEYAFPTEETGAVSLSPLTYEILESERYVNVLVTKNGNYVGEVQGTLSTLPGSASGENIFQLLLSV